MTRIEIHPVILMRSFLALVSFLIVLSITTCNNERTEKVLTNNSSNNQVHYGSKITLKKIPGGTFIMGENKGKTSEKPAHRVTLKDFYLGETEITIGQYVDFLNDCKPPENQRKEWIALKGEPVSIWMSLGWSMDEVDNNFPVEFKNDRYCVGETLLNNPVYYVSWFGADAFCRYYGYRLPTEEEWEYAAGGPNHLKWSLGNVFEGSKYCYRANPGKNYPLSVAIMSLPANGFGLYEMSGNIWEWCDNLYKNYGKSEKIDKTDEIESSYKVIRGGAWESTEDFLRCASRVGIHPKHKSNIVGFRVAADHE